MDIAHIEQIKVDPDRVRKSIDPTKVFELANSIAELGLMHPIVLRQDPDGALFLVAGETRLRAMEQLHLEGRDFKCGNLRVPHKYVPFLKFSDLTPDQALELEIEENIRRTDIPWQERCLAIAKLHKLRSDQNPEHTPADTAKEIGYVGRSETMDNLLVAQHLHDPEIATASSKKAAKQKVLARIEREFAAAIAASEARPEDERFQLIEGDAKLVLPTLPDGEFDLLLTDPPYGQNAHMIDNDHSVVHGYDDSWENVGPLLELLAHESFRVCAPQAHAYVFCAFDRFPALRGFFAKAGWWVWPKALVWFKDGGINSRPDYGPTYRYETILYAIKGDKPVVRRGAPDVLQYPRPAKRIHAAQKPEALLEDLISRSLHPGLGRILDPFAGSGSTFLAAAKRNHPAVGIENHPETLKLTRQSLDIAKGMKPELVA